MMRSITKISICFALTLALTQCGGFSGKRVSNRAPKNFELDASQALWRPSQTNDIPVAMNPAVERWVNLFQGRFKPNFDRWLSRLGAYGPTIETILKEEGVPKDLIYLAMIESGFNLTARSHASAVGPWQFISSTGRMYGLQNDYFMDDRSDLVKASRSAARHLKDLYKTYGDWYLAFAAYNAGPGTVNRAIRGTGSNDYWKHANSRFLRQETKDYVPKILAALHVVKNYRKFGYDSSSFSQPLQYDRVTVPDATDITVIARATNSDVEVIKSLNPHLTSGITRPGTSVGIFIPRGTRTAFLQNYSRLSEDERVSGLYHRAAPGETISSVARRYSLNKSRIARINNMGSEQRLSAGQIVRIPADRRVLTALSTNTFKATHNNRGSWATHRVRRGETLSRIANSYRTSTKNLMAWNRLGQKSYLRVGQSLKIYKAGGARQQQSQGALFFAANPNLFGGGRPRMSGVSHIIAQDQSQPLTVAAINKASKNTKSKDDPTLTRLVAVNTATDEVPANDEGPAIVKTIEDVSDESSNPFATTPTAMDRNLRAAQMVANTSYPHYSTTQPVVNRPVLPVRQQPVFHRVRSGENLLVIAKRYGVSVNTIRALNKVSGDRIHANQKLIIKNSSVTPNYSQANTLQRIQVKPVTLPRLSPQPQPVRPVVARTTPSQRLITHQTRSGDTLWKLSQRYGVKVADIKKWNTLRGDALRPNQKLRIYSGGSRSTYKL